MTSNSTDLPAKNTAGIMPAVSQQDEMSKADETITSSKQEANMKLTGKVAIITGGSRGIGRAIAIEFSRQGADSVIVARDDAGLAAVSADAKLAGRQCVPFRADVSNEDQVQSLVRFATEKFGHIDILVTSAGINIRKRTLETTLEEWNEVIAINLTGVFLCCKYVGETMARQRSGSIINISSVQGKIGGTSPHYSASKAGVLGLTRSLARELAPFNIRVNAVAPSGIETDMAKLWSPERRQQLINETLLKRLGQPEEVAQAIAFLASDEARYITGETLNINGGMLLD